VICNGEPGFPVEEFTSQKCRGNYPDAEKNASANSEKTILHVSKDSLRLISFNITTLLGAATHTRAPTQTRAHWQFELLYFGGCV